MWHWLLHVTGCDNLTGPWYGFWSGFAGCIPEFAVLVMIWRKVNCHAAGCHRVGMHRVHGTHYVTCRKHHPDHPGSKAATAEEIAAQQQGPVL